VALVSVDPVAVSDVAVVPSSVDPVGPADVSDPLPSAEPAVLDVVV
jgi:hypothetical protein